MGLVERYPRVPRLLCFLVAAFSLIHLVLLAQRIVAASLQMDFAVYATAGQVVSRGLDPYLNHVSEDTQLWDGGTLTPTSRFLYPPIAAKLFEPWGGLSYAESKAWWTLTLLFSAALTVLLSLRLMALRGAPALLAVACSAVFFPLHASLDRGQIEPILALVLLVVGIEVTRGRSSAALAVGPLLVLKPPAGLLLVIAGLHPVRVALAAVGGTLLTGFVVLAMGPSETLRYLTESLPRIAAHDQRGDGTLLAPAVLRDLFQLAPPGFGWKDGVLYYQSVLSFEPHCGLVPWVAKLPFGGLLPRLGWTLVGLGVLLLLSWRRVRALAFSASIDDRLRAWYAGLALVLLVAPLSWTMSLAWLLPLVTACIAWWQAGDRRPLLAAGLAWVGLPWLTIPWPEAPWAWPGRFSIGLVLVFCGLLIPGKKERGGA